MDSQSGHGKLLGVAIVALIVGFMVGLPFGGKSDNNNKSVAPVEAVSSPAADTRVALNTALKEHVNLGATTLRAVFDGSERANALVGTLDENSKEVASLVGSVYGADAETSFLSLWREHIDFFASYTVAAKNGDKAGMEKALEDLTGYSQEAAAFFEGANPNLPASAVQPLLKEHRDLVIAAVNAYGAGDLEKSYAKQAQAVDQAGDIADALAAGIVKQNPDAF